MTDNDGLVDPGVEYTWLIETSDDGSGWWQESHPVRGCDHAGGIERAVSAEDLARRVLNRRFAGLRGDTGFDWDELWFRVTVWDHRSSVDYAGWQQPPYLPEKAGTTPRDYGRYLQAHQAEPHAVETRTPRQVRAAVGLGAGARTAGRVGAISRTELDETLRELASLVDQAREGGYDSDSSTEHRCLVTARALVATLDGQLADRVDELEQHDHSQMRTSS